MKRPHLPVDPQFAILLLCGLFMILISGLLGAPLQKIRTGDLSIEQSYWIAPAGQSHSAELAKGQTFAPLSKVLFKGNLNSEAWLRVRFKTHPDGTAIVVGPAFTSGIELYAPQSGRIDRPFASGGYGSAMSFNRLNTLTFSSVWPGWVQQADQDRGTQEVLVRISSPTAYVWVSVMPLSEATDLDNALNASVGLFVGLALIMLMANAIAYVSTGETLWMSALLYIGVHLLYASMQSGMLPIYMPFLQQGWSSWLFAISVCGVTAYSGQLFGRLAQFFEVPTHWQWPYRLGAWGLVPELGLLAADRQDLCLLVCNLVLIAFSAFGLCVVWHTRHKSLFILWLYRGMLVVFASLTALWFFAAVLYKEIPFELMSATLAQNNFFSLLIVTIILGDHTWQTLRDRLELETQRKTAETRLALEAEKLQDASGFLTMVFKALKPALHLIHTEASQLRQQWSNKDSEDNRLDRIKQSASDIDAVLQRSLLVDNLQAGQFNIHIAPVDLHPILKDFVSMFDAKERISLQMPQPCVAKVDLNLILMMLRNLVDNALKYSPERSLVDIVVHLTPSSLVFRVYNHVGPAGVPDVNRLFTKYYRASTTQHISGTGLGLYWVKEVTQRLGGHLNFECIHQRIGFELWIPV